jgi:hypothetical protein
MLRARSSLLLLGLAGCADYSIGGKDGAGDPDGADTDYAYEPGDTAAYDTAVGGGGGLPPEDERDPFRLRPAQTDVYVFVANPDRDTVTRIQVLTREVRTVRVGRRPSAVEVTPDWRTAVVFDKLDDTVSLVDALSLERTVVGVRDNLNALALSPDGRWALVWHDVGAEQPDDPAPGAVASFVEVSLVDVQGARHVPLVVGFVPKAVRFTPDGTLALVVSVASIAAIHLDEAEPVPEYVQLADPLSPPVAEEVVIAPDGTFAFVRQRDADTVAVVDLLTKEVTPVAVPAGPTDLDLTADGRHAVVVSRGAHKVSLIDVADPFAPPHEVAVPDDEPLGSVLLGRDDLAVLYTTTGASGRYATWDLSNDQIRLRPLAKPVAGLARTPDGASLLVVHGVADNPDGSTLEPYRGKQAVSLISLEDFRANTIVLDAPVKGFANSSDGRRGYLVLEDEPVLEVLDYASLIDDEIPLRSAPVFVGVLPELDPEDGDEPPCWVSQEHALGRISFYDPDDASLETITGFELNGSIEE